MKPDSAETAHNLRAFSRRTRDISTRRAIFTGRRFRYHPEDSEAAERLQKLTTQP